MNSLLHHLIIFGLCGSSFAAPSSEKNPSANKQLIETLFASRDSAEFHDAIKKAKASGISEQATLEARFLYYVDKQENKQLAALSHELIPRLDKFDPSQSEIFTVKEDWQAIVHFTQAVAALEAGKNNDFKEHITEAFWLSPRQAPAFAPYIDKLRLSEAMSTAKIPADLALANMIPLEDPTTFGALAKNQAAVLLHFWSPWSREIDLTLEDFSSTCTEAKKHKIAVASILTERSKEVDEDALIFVRESAKDVDCRWLRDNEKAPLTQLMRVQNLPTVVLLTPDGKVLFNGHPTDPDLWDAIKKVAPQFKKPDAAAQDPADELDEEPNPDSTEDDE